MVLPRESSEPAALLAAIETERCTTLLGEPALFAAVLEHAASSRFDLSSLRAAVIGGGPCPVEVVKGLRTSMGVEQMALVGGTGERAR
jgi:fatty-acyl-CoA synthase